MTHKRIEELVNQVLLLLKQEGYKREVVDSHRRNLCRIKEYMDYSHLQSYSVSVGESYLLSLIEESATKRYKYKSMKSTINLLNDTLNEVPVRRKRVSKKVYPLPGEIGLQVKAFLEHFKRTELPNDKTVYKYNLALSRFSVRMDLDNVNLSTLNEVSVKQFMSTVENSRANVYLPLRRFLCYLYEKSLIPNDISAPLYRIKKYETEKLPSIYDINEIKQMESVIDRNTPKGKRDYAMFLLASRLGLRASDIALFKFGYIDWDNNLINFQQYKTAKEVELPLLRAVGEAIIDYIKYGRPQSNSKTLFLSSNAPYFEITASLVGATINNIIRKARVFTKNRHAGSHSLRHSLATQLLEQGNTLPLISEILGHSNSQNTMTYLNVDIKSLLSCSLDVPPVPESFYLQEGGVFYE